MEEEKYEKLSKSILSCLKDNSELSHKELFSLVTENFKKNKTDFEAFLEWHMEWVKQDLETKGKIKRIGDKSSLRFTINKANNPKATPVAKTFIMSPEIRS